MLEGLAGLNYSLVGRSPTWNKFQNTPRCFFPISLFFSFLFPFFEIPAVRSPLPVHLDLGTERKNNGKIVAFKLFHLKFKMFEFPLSRTRMGIATTATVVISSG